jgi:hypothetical protein
MFLVALVQCLGFQPKCMTSLCLCYYEFDVITEVKDAVANQKSPAQIRRRQGVVDT